LWSVVYQSVFRVGSCVGASVRAFEKPPVHELCEERLACWRVYAPEALHLRLGQLETWHFLKFAPNNRKPVLDSCLKRAHDALRPWVALKLEEQGSYQLIHRLNQGEPFAPLGNVSRRRVNTRT
jgi:hypothetical protein